MDLHAKLDAIFRSGEEDTNHTIAVSETIDTFFDRMEANGKRGNPVPQPDVESTVVATLNPILSAMGSPRLAEWLLEDHPPDLMFWFGLGQYAAQLIESGDCRLAQFVRFAGTGLNRICAETILREMKSIASVRSNGE